MNGVVEFFKNGGMFMYPILVCSIMSLGFFIFKVITLRREKVLPSVLIKAAKKIIRERDLEEAYSFCSRYPSPIGKIMLAVVKNVNKGKAELKEKVEEIGKSEVVELERFVEAIGAIAGLSTLLGLLGTVSGLIRIFSTISADPVANPAKLAAGISEALNNTMFGLLVAIPSIVFFKFLEGKVIRLTTDIEVEAGKMIEIAEGGE